MDTPHPNRFRCRRRSWRCTSALRLFPAFRPPYGWGRILAGAAKMEQDDPGWWHLDASPAVDVDAMQVADLYTCVVAQRHPGEQRPFRAGLRRLGIRPAEAADFGLDGVDAELLTPGWQLLISVLRAGVRLDELAGLS